jgi:hypothetical protein
VPVHAVETVEDARAVDLHHEMQPSASFAHPTAKSQEWKKGGK